MADLPDVRVKKLEAMLDVARSAMAAFDSDGRLIHRNFSEQQLLAIPDDEDPIGHSVQEYLSRFQWRTIDNQPLPVEQLPIMRALAGEEVYEERLIVERDTDDLRYLLQNARPLMIDGESQGAAVLTLDLTSLRSFSDQSYTDQLENAVRRSRMIADIVTEIGDTTSALNLDLMTEFAIERVSREFRAKSGVLWLLDSADRLHLKARYAMDCVDLAADGYPLEEFEFAHEALQRNIPLVVDRDDLRAPEAVVKCMGEAQSVLVIPLRIRGERIGIAYLCISNRYLLDASDRLFASVWGRQCAQGIDAAMLFAQVDEANQRLVQVVDQLPQAVLLFDSATGGVRIANRGAADLFHREVNQTVSLNDLPMMDADGTPLRGSRHPLLRAMRNGGRVTGDVLLVPQPDDTVREVVANHVSIRDGRDQITGGITVLQDRADFATMDRARYEFISVVAHELRNPLTSLRGNLQLLERRVRRRELDEQTEDDLRRIGVAISEADRIGDLVTRVLDVSHAGMGRLDIVPQTMDAARLLRDVCEAAQARQPEREVRCAVPTSVPVEWDPDRIYQVLSNLTQNADRYAPGAPLELSLDQTDPNRVRITVRDHGPGVPPQLRRKLFRNYYRFDDDTTDSTAYMTDGSRGLGIGLYVSARLVQQHGGRLTVHDAEGGGAEFVVTLPRIARPASARI